MSEEPLILRFAYADEQDFADRLAAELAKHGWGDFHYGAQPQDPAIVALLNEHARRRVTRA